MTGKDIDAIARKRNPLPDDAGLCDMMLYHILTALYREYKEGIISKELARTEKARAMEKHRDAELWERIYKENTRRITELDRIASESFREHKCPLCTKMYDIFTGIYRSEYADCDDHSVSGLIDE